VKKHIYPIVYTAILILALFFPFDFDSRVNHAEWAKSENGIQIEERGQLISTANSLGLYEKLIQGSGLTLEVWLKTEDLMQDGPARILTYSVDPNFRNFTLAQSEDRLIMRLRTEQTDLNGVFPHMAVPRVFEASEKTHIVVTYDFQKQCVYINGEKRTCDNTPGGNFSNWDPEFRLVLANEASGDRPWLGDVYYAAIYDRALTRAEITRQFSRGMAMVGLSDSNDSGTDNHPIVRYRFDQKRGGKVIDTGTAGLNLDLDIPARLPLTADMFSISQLSKMKDNLFSLYTLSHILLFIPVGVFFHRRLKRRFTSAFTTVLFVLIIGVIGSFALEILQPFLTSRTSSLVDVMANLIGLSIGIIIDRLRMKRGAFVVAKR
jgi:glycopeptide antibiotics resistance protein